MRNLGFKLFAIVPVLLLFSGDAVAGEHRHPRRPPPTCKTRLDNNSYTCLALSEQGEYFPMRLDFTGSEGNLFVLVNESIQGACSCQAKYPNVYRTSSIGFDKSTEFQCVTPGGTDSSGGEIGGPEVSGPETFSLDFAAYQGEATKHRIKGGQAVDQLGRPIVYACGLLSGPEPQ